MKKHEHTLDICLKRVEVYAALISCDSTIKYAGPPDDLYECMRKAREFIGDDTK